MVVMFIHPKIYYKLRTALIFKLDKDIDEILKEIGVEKILKYKVSKNYIECIDINGNKIYIKNFIEEEERSGHGSF